MSWAVWIAGRPGAARSAVAEAAAAALAADGGQVVRLELEELRRLLTPAPTGSEIERDLVHRALVYAAAALVDAGIPVVIDAAGERRVWRDAARSVIGKFAEVEVLSAGGESVAGEPYEEAGAADVAVDAEHAGAAACAARVAGLLAGWPRPKAEHGRRRWAVWITGLPGSGKTTIASRVAEALGRVGERVRILELADVRALLRDGWSPLAEDIAHRALVYTAKQLAAAGVPVIIDATAPARAWRALAREQIERFAEVQLRCPAEICGERERVVRWGLLGCPQRQPARAPERPDIVLAYEPSVSPELTIDTDVENGWSAAEAVVRLARRLDAVDVRGRNTDRRGE
jgi:adenylylsulfate kinase